MYPSRHSHTHPAPLRVGVVVSGSQPSTLSLHASSVGMCVGAVVVAVVVGAVVGVCDGSTVGATVGAIVDEHRVASVGSATYPSRHSHTHSLPAFTAIVVCRSQPPLFLSHGCSVGAYVGAVVMSSLGGSVGGKEGLIVGCSVGAPVAIQCSESAGSVVNPSRHSQNAVSTPSADFATTHMVVAGSQP